VKIVIKKFPSRESRKRDAAIRLILEKTQHSPYFLRLCVRFSLCGDMLRLSYFSIAAFTLSAYAFRHIGGKNENCDFRFCKKLFPFTLFVLS